MQMLVFASLAFILASFSQASVSPDCDGLPRRVKVRVSSHEPRYLTDATEVPEDGSAEISSEVCEVTWLAHGDLVRPSGRGAAWELDEKAVDGALEAADVVLTDSLDAVPFAGRRGRLAFLERVLPMPQLSSDEMDAALAEKQQLFSIVLPSKSSTAWDDPQTQQIAEQVLSVVPDHTFVDDGAIGTYRKAFLPYRFSLIVDDQNHTISQALVHCIAWGAIPLFNGFTHLFAMLPRMVLPWDRSNFQVQMIQLFLPDTNYEIGWMWQQHRLLQDQLLYRYRHDFDARLASFACTLCRLGSLRPSKEQATSRTVHLSIAPLAFVGVYSAGANFAKREAVRSTWGGILKSAYAFRIRFFLGRLSMAASRNAERIRDEMELHDDLVILDVEEGYKMNSQKGLLFLEWCALHVRAQFLVKVDDDVHFRPLPLLALLQQRPPVGYVWGYFDHFSPVPRTEGNAFYNSEEAYPFTAFPPYARGLVRTLSMDVVRGLVGLSGEGSLRMIFGDDPCFGVHLRHLREDKHARCPLLALDDRDSYRVFAMEPSCNPGLWSHVTQRSWVVHHVTPEQMHCMWTADREAGTYVPDGGSRADMSMLRPSATALVIAESAAAVATQGWGEVFEAPGLPDVCSCLETGPLAAELSQRRDKINASKTYQMWGHPNLLDDDMYA